jgi:nicotinate-nucleotide pyrophosphorylase (carboxylating)
LSDFQLSRAQVQGVIKTALAEDMAGNDVTSEALIPPDMEARAEIIAKEDGVLAGGEVAEWIFQTVDPAINIQLFVEEGARIRTGDVLARVSGKLNSILRAERTVLNFLQRMSGIASRTAEYVARAGETGLDIADTRKTTPGLRLLEKYAVRMGGGKSHRFSLADAVLIKDNHIAALRSLGMGLKEIIALARQKAPQGITIEVEVNSVGEAVEAAESGADIVMLDNMGLDEMRQVVGLLKGKVILEASGGINLDTVRGVAETGIDYLSVGALTHSVKSLDINLEIEPRSAG